jgi:hypothetical protein
MPQESPSETGDVYFSVRYFAPFLASMYIFSYAPTTDDAYGNGIARAAKAPPQKLQIELYA